MLCHGNLALQARVQHLETCIGKSQCNDAEDKLESARPDLEDKSRECKYWVSQVTQLREERTALYTANQTLQEQLSAAEHAMHGWIINSNLLEEQNRHLQDLLHRRPD
eukprot:934700-Karenia_brevis.AAC.1